MTRYYYVTGREPLPALQPKHLEIRCPRCGGHAEYYFHCLQWVWKGRVKETRIWAKQQPFPFDLWPNKGQAGWGVLAWFPKQLQANKEGVAQCTKCATRKAYTVNWPKDAWFQIQVFDEVLWAHNRSGFLAVRDYLIAASRSEYLKKRKAPSASMLAKIPRKLMALKYRKRAVQQVDRFLQEEVDR